MKKISQYQLAIMFLDELPSKYDYKSLKREIDKSLALFKNEKKVFEINSENNAQVPSEMVRLAYESQEASLHISASNISLTLKDNAKEALSIEVLESGIKEAEHIVEFISNIYRLRYRFGIVIIEELDGETLKTSLKNDINRNVDECPEVEFSLLTEKNFGNNTINLWNRRIYNNNENRYLHVVDINTSEKMKIQFGNDRLFDIYIEYFKDLIKEAHDEFKE